jgi:cation transport ATPase
MALETVALLTPSFSAISETLALAFMALSSISVTLNALRLRRA